MKLLSGKISVTRCKAGYRPAVVVRGEEVLRQVEAELDLDRRQRARSRGAADSAGVAPAQGVVDAEKVAKLAHCDRPLRRPQQPGGFADAAKVRLSYFSAAFSSLIEPFAALDASNSRARSAARRSVSSAPMPANVSPISVNFRPAAERVTFARQRLGGGHLVGEGAVDPRLVARRPAVAHRQDLEPADGRVGRLRRAPGVRAGEELEAMRHAGLGGDRVELARRLVVEVALAGRREEGELRDERQMLGRRAAADRDHAGEIVPLEPDRPGEDCAAGESSRIDAFLVDRQALHDVRDHRVDGAGIGLARPVAHGVVGAREDPAELVGGAAKELRRELAARARVEEDQHRPLASRQRKLFGR